MLNAIRSETLRSISGLAFLAVLAFAVMIPALLLNSLVGSDVLKALPAPDASARVFSITASSFVVSMFVGSYSVTREYYYGSLDRSRVLFSPRRLFWAKVIASVLTSVALAAVLGVAWVAVSVWLMSEQGVDFIYSFAITRIFVGSLVASALGAIIGHGVGWAVRNYYVACALVLAIPLAAELPLLLNAPDVEKFLPSGAAAGVTNVAGLDVLPVVAAFAVSLLWAAGATVLGLILATRRQ
ncbi:hypothetical protein SAMN06295924_10112 [Rathayibacter rathayi NCPPB 2980 = VKM Ac-1601]|nr:hypothetical protein FB469_0898 [Rathayibacter rathayi]SOE01717.1 hypothetical protein SAMN06295924_10112 [Rathayibacter rathayi NCPPB 2980 = VKM Ac-1601]